MSNNFLLTSTTATIFLILLFHSPLSAANSAVLDTDGNPLQPSSRYYILTSGRGAAGRGGLSTGPKPNCPQYVFQLYNSLEKGTPVTILPFNSSKKVITVSMEVNFDFGPNPNCNNTLGMWKLDSLNGVITMISTEGNFKDPNSRFEIREVFPGSYQIVYCFVAPFNNMGFSNPWHQCDQVDPNLPTLVGYYLGLAPIDQALPFLGFVFQKVDEGGTTATAATATAVY